MGDRESSNGSFLQGLITGAVIGAGLFYFLTSTKEGQRVKERIKEESEGAFEALAGLTEELEQRGEEFRDRAKKIQAELEKRVESGQGREAEEAKEKISHIDSLRERGREVTKKFFVRNGKSLN